MYLLDVVVGPMIAILALQLLIPVLLAVTVIMLIVRWIKNRKNKNKTEKEKENEPAQTE